VATVTDQNKMARYVTLFRRHRADGEWWEDRVSPHSSITVCEPHDEKPLETGLYDKHGNELYRVPENRRPAGFLASWKDGI
jgi:hypothetical protein